MYHLLHRWGRWSARHPWRVLTGWLAASVLVVGASAGFGASLVDTMAAPGTDSQAATDLISGSGQGTAGLTAYVTATPTEPGAGFADARPRAALADLRARLAQLPNLLSVSDPVVALDAGPQAAAAAQAVSADGRVAVLRLQYPAIEQLSKTDLTNLKDALSDAGTGSALQLEAGGDLYFSFEESPTNVGEAIGLLVALVVLLVAFGSLLAAGLPMVIALLGLLVGASLLPLLAHVVGIPVWSPAMASMVGLGVGIDYALFLLTRYREQLSTGVSVPEAVGRALATAGQSVVVAGGIVVVSILGLVAAGLPWVTAGGIGIATVVLVMVLAAVTLLPALLGLGGHRLAGRGLLGRRRGTGDAAVRRWTAWGRHVTRHAAAYAVAGTTLLLALAAPLLAMRVGLPDQGTYPESRTERRAYDLLADGFGPGAPGPFVVAVDTGGDKNVVERVAAGVGADSGIARVDVLPTDSNVAVLVAQPTTAPQSAATQQTLDRLRADVLPGAISGSTASAHVGGYGATFADLGERVRDRLPLFVSTVVLLSFVLLTIVFRSIAVPLKAAVLNLLSVAAAYGVLVMVFQWGWGADLIGLESTVPVVSFIPLFMFAILFGLSMDYEVFLLSRVREEWLRTRDSDGAVVHGIGVTARTISSGAAIMVAVFAGFVLGQDPLIKMLGLGLATAVLVDATVIRLVLVPAVMRLLGPANWWLPRWLDRLLPHIDAHPEVVDPVPVPVLRLGPERRELDQV